jgi:hypothetical protein
VYGTRNGISVNARAETHFGEKMDIVRKCGVEMFLDLPRFSTSI